MKDDATRIAEHEAYLGNSRAEITWLTDCDIATLRAGIAWALRR